MKELRVPGNLLARINWISTPKYLEKLKVVGIVESLEVFTKFTQGCPIKEIELPFNSLNSCLISPSVRKLTATLDSFKLIGSCVTAFVEMLKTTNLEEINFESIKPLTLDKQTNILQKAGRHPMDFTGNMFSEVRVPYEADCMLTVLSPLPSDKFAAEYIRSFMQ